MDWFLQNWQSVAAAVVVAATVLVFALRILRRAPRTACGRDCGCGLPPKSDR